MLKNFTLIAKAQAVSSTLPKVSSCLIMKRSQSSLRTSDIRLELEVGFCRCGLVDMLTHLPFFILISLLFFSSAPSLYHLYSGVGFPEASHFTISLLPSSTNTGFLICFSVGAAAER